MKSTKFRAPTLLPAAGAVLGTALPRAVFGPGAVVEPMRVLKHSARESGDPTIDPGDGLRVRVENREDTSTMHESGKSDSLIVPGKPPNKVAGALASAEEVEERGLAKGNPHQSPQTRTQCRRALMLKLRRIRQVARQRSTPARHHLRQEPGAVVPHAGICAGAAR